MEMIVIGWLILAALFMLGEIAIPGTLFLLGFSLMSSLAGLLAWLEYPFYWQLMMLMGGSLVSFLGTIWYFKQRKPSGPKDGYCLSIYALIGRQALLKQVLAEGNAGYISIEGQPWLVRWGASSDLKVGMMVQIVGLIGSHLVVQKV